MTKLRTENTGSEGRSLHLLLRALGVILCNAEKATGSRFSGVLTWSKKMNHGELLAASGEDPLDFSDFAEVFLQDGSVVEVVGDVLALDGCEL